MNTEVSESRNDRFALYRIVLECGLKMLEKNLVPQFQSFEEGIVQHQWLHESGWQRVL